MAVLSVDLFAFGNQSRPRPPRANLDLFPDSGGMVGPITTWPWQGASTFASLAHVPLTGHYHKLPRGTVLPQGIGVVADGMDVDPASLHLATHHTIFPAERMSFDRFVQLYLNLPWEYGGKK